MASKRYIIMELSEAKALVDLAKPKFSIFTIFHPLRRVFKRIEAETGADIQGLVDQLKSCEPCPGGAENACIDTDVKKIARRLSRLIERAN